MANVYILKIVTNILNIQEYEEEKEQKQSNKWTKPINRTWEKINKCSLKIQKEPQLCSE